MISFIPRDSCNTAWYVLLHLLIFKYWCIIHFVNRDRTKLVLVNYCADPCLWMVSAKLSSWWYSYYELSYFYVWPSMWQAHEYVSSCYKHQLWILILGSTNHTWDTWETLQVTQYTWLLGKNDMILNLVNDHT